MKFILDSKLEFLKEIPAKAGVYRFFNSDELLLYVGKAINLPKRIKSYFRKTNTPRIALMVSQIYLIEVTVTQNEEEALLLEHSLIKNLKPKYNIVFRDDKSYPFIRLSQDSYPQFEYFRTKDLKKELLWGPYANPGAVKINLELLQSVIKFRTCSISEFTNRTRACTLYQINRCSAPCVGYISKEEYKKNISLGVKFLNGEFGELLENLSVEMDKAALSLDFEKALSLREKIYAIKEIQNTQIISEYQHHLTADIIATKLENNKIHISLIKIKNGIYIYDKYFEEKLIDNQEELLKAFLESYYLTAQKPPLIYLNHKFSTKYQAYFYYYYKIKLSHEYHSRIANLILQAENNLSSQINLALKTQVNLASLKKLSTLLNIPAINRIECYDISHLHGSSGIAAMSVYADGKINTSLYRKFNLAKDYNGNDLEALSSVLKRRLNNLDWPIPQVILFDGGVLQFKALKKLLTELKIYDKIRPLAIYKGENRRPELDTLIIDLEYQISFKESPEIVKLLQILRDEAHRFAITGHRKKQLVKMTASQLDSISGVGRKTKQVLLAYFGSVSALSQASIDELKQIKGVGDKLARTIHLFFKNEVL